MAGEGLSQAMKDELRATVIAMGEDPDWWDKQAAKPGNTWVLPSQGTEHRSPTGNLNFQYPFFRSDLVEAGLLPAEAPPGNPREITLPPGMSVVDAIRAGVLR